MYKELVSAIITAIILYAVLNYFYYKTSSNCKFACTHRGFGLYRMDLNCYCGRVYANNTVAWKEVGSWLDMMTLNRSLG